MTKTFLICLPSVRIASVSSSASFNQRTTFLPAYDLGHELSEHEELIEFLQRIPAGELMKHTSNSKFVASEGEPKTTYIEWNPTIESK